jgi:hypothetical protein
MSSYLTWLDSYIAGARQSLEKQSPGIAKTWGIDNDRDAMFYIEPVASFSWYKRVED